MGSVDRRIASGDYGRRVKYKRNDELGVLARTINEMGETLQQKVEQVIYEKNRLETVVSAMTSGVILCNDRGEVDFLNDAAAVIFDLPKDKVTGLPLEQAFRSFLFYDQYQETLASGELKSFDLISFSRKPGFCKCI